MLRIYFSVLFSPGGVARTSTLRERNINEGEGKDRGRRAICCNAGVGEGWVVRLDSCGHEAGRGLQEVQYAIPDVCGAQ